MPSALSVDLRERMVAAIEAGASRRQAAKRFGVGAASAVRWYERFRQDGQIAPKPMGGDRNSQRLEAQAALILRLMYGWLLRVKDVGSVRVNWSVAAMYTASDLQRDRRAP